MTTTENGRGFGPKQGHDRARKRARSIDCHARSSDDGGGGDEVTTLDLPFFLTTDDVADLLRCAALGSTPADVQENRRRQARYWLRVHRVPVVGRGKRHLVRRDALFEALAEAETPAAL